MNQWANIILYIISTNTCAIKQKSNNTTKATRRCRFYGGLVINESIDKNSFVNDFNKYMCSLNKIQITYQKLHGAITMA